jgi:hydrogenase maturation protein HypF
VAEGYPFKLNAGTPLIVDWQPMIKKIVEDVRRGQPVGIISAKFHNALAEMIVAVAREVGERKVALTGGCFQNRRLLEKCVDRLVAEGFQPYWHQRVPPNDGGISLGQVMAVCESFNK